MTKEQQLIKLQEENNKLIEEITKIDNRTKAIQQSIAKIIEKELMNK